MPGYARSTGTKPSITRESGSARQSTASTCTPPAAAWRRAWPKAGSVRSLGRNTVGPFIWITKHTAARYPCSTARSKPRRCLAPRWVGASGNLTSPASSRVTPFTSTKIGPCPSSRRKSKRESPQVNSCRIAVTSGRNPPAAAHSPKTLLGACASILISRSPLRTAIRSYCVFRMGFPARSRYTTAPGTSSSRQRPVFFTWQISVLPSTSTWAINRLGRCTKRPSYTSVYLIVRLPVVFFIITRLTRKRNTGQFRKFAGIGGKYIEFPRFLCYNLGIFAQVIIVNIFTCKPRARNFRPRVQSF